MLEKSWKVGALLLAVLGGACSSKATDKSTGTNWISCTTDADCAGHPGTLCGPDDRYVSALPPNADAGSGGSGGVAPTYDGGVFGAGGRSSTGGSVGSGGASLGTGGGTIGSGGKVGTGGSRSDGVGVLSPGQNTETAYDDGAFGCKCLVSEVPNGLCVKGRPPYGPGAYRCQDRHWQSVDEPNGPCNGCWTPDQPEFANAYPDNGCPCVNENETTCIVTQGDGYKNAVCRGGTWKVDATLSTCTCTSDARCGFGGKCVEGACAHRECEVDGVRYAPGVDFPDPSDECNTCQCDAYGARTCTLINCAPTVCPGNTIQASTCVGCGQVGGCALWRYGCLPRCETDADCAGTGTPMCDTTTTHVCGSGPCL